jgi:hypothetical protein
MRFAEFYACISLSEDRPMTIACRVANAITARSRAHNLPAPEGRTD